MSIIDKVIAAVTPPESEDARRQARAKATSAATAGDWLSLVLQHHRQIETAFSMVKEASSATAQQAAQKKLATLLTGHSVAEESALYPALSQADETSHATQAYTEQSAAKLQLGLLERLTPLSQDYLDKLEHIRGAVAHHMYEEEGNWFLDLRQKLSQSEQNRLLSRYTEEFTRYMGSEAAVPGVVASEAVA